jgi:hypothetical protein
VPGALYVAPVTAIPELLRAWDERLRRDMSRFDTPAAEIIERGSVLRDPAGEEDVHRAERRLGVTFPPEYRALLLSSNGAHASSLGPELQHWDDTYRHGLLPADRVQRFPDLEDGPFLLDLWTGSDAADVFMDPERDTRPQDDEPVNVTWYAPLKDALLISGPVDAFKDLLVPKPGIEEWELWTFASDGAVAYRSVGAFLRHRINQTDRRPNPELADLYAAEVRAGNRMRLDDLAEIGDPRVGPLAFAYLLDPNVDEFAKRGWSQPLAKLADPAFIPDLRRCYEEATLHDHRLLLLAALIACGDPDVHVELRRIADTEPNDQLREWATFHLDRLERSASPER